MKIFVLNCGSSSIKSYLYHFKSPSEDPILAWEAKMEWKNGFEAPSLSVKKRDGFAHTEVIEEKKKEAALERLVHLLITGKTAALHSLDELSAIGHRIVHGGAEFTTSVRITAEVKQKIRSVSELAPLHNLAEVEGVELLEKHFPQIPHIAVFDTTFHRTLSPVAQIYPGPHWWFEEGIRRYGFHGISFQYCARRLFKILKKGPANLKAIICHLGSGASLCAIKGGKSIDTTMGFTPLDGLMMDTRCGSIDPGILLYFLEKKKRSAEEISKELYNDSGLLGVSENSSDMRDIIAKSLAGDSKAILAFEVYLHRLNHLIGAMIATLQGVDAIIFTAGIGENAPLLRKRVCDNFSFLGIQLDPIQNEREHRGDCILSTPKSKVDVLLMHTQEALEIATECLKFV